MTLTFRLRYGTVVTLFCTMGIMMAGGYMAAEYRWFTRLSTTIENTVQSGNETPQSKQYQRRNLKKRDRNTFAELIDPADVQLFKKAMKAAEHGDWAHVNHLMKHVNSSVMDADIRATYYLHSKTNATYSDLHDWLERHPQHPDTNRIYQLAKAKRQSDDPALPMIDRRTRSLVGHGVRDGLFQRNRPSGWRHALNMYAGGKCAQARKQFAAISERPKLSSWYRSAAHYWAYRATTCAQQNENDGTFHLIQASMHPFTLYGALAVHKLSYPLYKHADAAISHDILAMPAVQRAAAFAHMNQPNKAARELRYAFYRVDNDTKRGLIDVAAALDLPATQLRISQMRFKNPEHSDISAYPTPDWLPEQMVDTDPALIYAIIRQESAFHPKAKSHAGAIGVMQLMPATARYVYKQMHDSPFRQASFNPSQPSQDGFSLQALYQPEINIAFGQHYLRYLSEKPYIRGNLVYMLAAYNAGPGNLYNWQKTGRYANDPLLFVEHIPFTETRHYVMQVLANAMIYESLLHEGSRTANALNAGQWPQFNGNAGFAHLKTDAADYALLSGTH